ncbi:hypothetical protein C5167_044504 [Papaver somniferum]|uniref:Uncharacterized protein n=1 Tax=Papaver somniferum TaxID=3469 RepID=A0A4Y7LB77_PAPSO|nr:hypothetical protein C5167_044504 [Papaver somniferum]
MISAALTDLCMLNFGFTRALIIVVHQLHCLDAADGWEHQIVNKSDRFWKGLFTHFGLGDCAHVIGRLHMARRTGELLQMLPWPALYANCVGWNPRNLRMLGVPLNEVLQHCVGDYANKRKYRKFYNDELGGRMVYVSLDLTGKHLLQVIYGTRHRLAARNVTWAFQSCELCWLETVESAHAGIISLKITIHQFNDLDAADGLNFKLWENQIGFRRDDVQNTRLESSETRIELDLTLAHAVDDGMRYYFGLVV